MFVGLLAVYLVSALSTSPGTGSRVINFLSVLVVFFGLRAMTRRRRVFWLGMGLTLVFALVSATIHVTVDKATYRGDTLVVLVLFTFMLGVIGKVVMKREPVTIDKIFAAASFYMLMGIVFGLVFALVEQSSPGSFTLAAAEENQLAGSLIHFSFTTLTTVGYGNISPVSSLARSLSDIEAVIAQLFLAVVVARLVSLQITQGDRFDEEI